MGDYKRQIRYRTMSSKRDIYICVKITPVYRYIHTSIHHNGYNIVFGTMGVVVVQALPEIMRLPALHTQVCLIIHPASAFKQLRAKEPAWPCESCSGRMPQLSKSFP